MGEGEAGKLMVVEIRGERGEATLRITGGGIGQCLTSTRVLQFDALAI